MINLLLPLNLQYFADEQPPVDGAETNPVAEVPAETKVESSEAPSETQEKLLTQAEFEEALKKRLERERKKFEKYSDYDDLKKKLSEYEQQAEEKRLSELSEVEKAQELASKYEAELNDLKAALDAERTKAQEQAIKNEFIKVASGANIIDIEAAIALSDLSAVAIGDDGAVVGVDDVIKTLVENKPYLVAKKTTQPIGSATNSGTSKYVDKSADQLLAEAAQKARKSGRVEDRVAFDKLKRELGK